MNIKKTELDGVIIIEPVVFEDHRGFFMESYNQQKFMDLGLEFEFVQDNHSLSVDTGTIRGLHYQLHPKTQTKLVRVLSGSILDVVVDIRENSPTYGNWIRVELSRKNKRQILIPKGFAHGFCTLESNTEVLYKVDEYYSPEHDRGIRWNDSDIGIPWPVSHPILSVKDKEYPFLKDAEKTLNIQG